MMAGYPGPDSATINGEEESKNAILTGKPPTSIRITRSAVDSNTQENGDRQLSYVNLACCLTGYTDLTRYNSRLRDGFRSREASPARFILDTSTHNTKDMACLRPSLNPAEVSPKTSETYTSSSETVSSSFIEQRIARLYGSSAVANGVQRKALSPASTSLQRTCSEEVKAAGEENDSENLPVMKLLRPEFLAQFQFRSTKSPLGKSNARVSRGRQSEDEIQSQSSLPNGNCVNSKISEEAALEESSCNLNKITLNGDSVDGTALKSKNVPVKLVSILADEKNGYYYLKILHEEMNNLQKLSEEYQVHLAQVTDDVADLIRLAVGKAQLLCNQKLKQFESLCYKNINQKPDEPYPATCEDLGGFWDLVVIQIDAVKSEFSVLEKIKLAGWIIQDEKVPKISNGVSQKKTELNNNARVSKTKSGATNNKPTEKAKKQREDLRKKMAEERKKLALQRESSGSDILLL